ncbi:hypothetical protein [Streptomyces massasporeus]|uniref:hypothetical protein n=1 Tax=Streptomyces massasporeus TaxID=67324 RepID=UPI003715F30D
MALAFEDLMTLQRTADEAHTRLQRHYDAYGRTPPSQWTQKQRSEWRAAWAAWVKAVSDLHEAVSAYAAEHDGLQSRVGADVKQAARPPKPPT